MRRFTIIASLLSAAIVLSATVAAANDWVDCWNWEDNPDRSIVTCTELIEKGVLANGDLSQAYQYRGNAYNEKHNYSRAMAD